MGADILEWVVGLAAKSLLWEKWIDDEVDAVEFVSLTSANEDWVRSLGDALGGGSISILDRSDGAVRQSEME